MWFKTLLLFVFVLNNYFVYSQEQACGTDELSIDESMIEFIEEESGSGGLVITLKILLVEFSDVKHRTPAYTYTNFNNLFFSNNIYISPNMYSPDGEQVFGSMKDYYDIMSDGLLDLTGYIVNTPSANPIIPQWISLPNTKNYYNANSFSTFVSACTNAAISAGYNISTNSTTKLAIIYAGHTYRGTPAPGLNPRASGSTYINGELFAAFGPYDEERSDAEFQEIGVHVHEFAHLLGAPDLYDNGRWDILNGGPYLGPNLRGACPAPFNPVTRERWGWTGTQVISSNAQHNSDYYLQDPEIFRINNSTNNNYSYFVETRKFDAPMTIGTTTTNDYNYYILHQFFSNPASKGVLVWEKNSSSTAGSWGTLLRANGDEWVDWTNVSEGNLYPGAENVVLLAPWTDSRTSPAWVPNTKPSTNVGMEIVSEESNYFVLNLYSGITNLPSSISANTTLNGAYYVPSNVTVNAGVTLTIQPGTSIYYANNVTMTVNGVVNAQGISGNPIRFTSATATSASSWNSIQEKNGNSIFKWCIFEYGSTPLNVSSSSGNLTTIENCTFRNNNYNGLNVGAYGRVKVKSCQIYNNNSAGIYCSYSSDLDLIGNRIYNNGGSGISSHSGNLIELFGNVIEYNGGKGISPAYGDIIRIGKVYSWWGYNTVRENSGNEVYNYHATVEISGASIHDDSPWEIYNTSGDPTINAQSVYWGTNGPQVSGSVNLMASVEWSLPSWDGQTKTSGSPIGKVADSPLAGEIEWYWDPSTSDYEKIKIGKNIISQKPESSDAKEALKHIYSIIRSDYRENILAEKDNFFEYMKEINKKYSAFEIGNLAYKYMILWKMLEEDITSVINLSNEALKYFYKEDRNWILTALVLTYKNVGLINESRNALAELRANSNDKDEFLSYLESDINETERQIAEGNFKPKEFAKNSGDEKLVPISTGLSQNYPNPFNPLTSINYQISEEGFVTLKIYDVLGKEVKTLINENKNIGRYEVKFDASDLASGMYIYQLKVNNPKGTGFVVSKKMLLVK